MDGAGLLNGRVALITGAARGIGFGIAGRFGAESASIGVLDLNPTACENAVACLATRGIRAVALPADVSSSAGVSGAVAKLIETFGAPDILLHNAAIMPEGTLDATSEQDWDRVFQINVKGAYLAAREVVPLMRRRGGGNIIFMASLTGMLGFPGLAAYSATKGALISLARAMAIDHAREGIRVNSISPGTVDSPMLHEFAAKQSDPKRTLQVFDEIHPVGRVATIAEVANIALFLASSLSSHVTGANLVVDGGLSVKGEQPRL